MVRAFLSPKAHKGDPSCLLGFSIPVTLGFLCELVQRNPRRLYKLFNNVSYALSISKVPRGRVVNPKLFIGLFKGLTNDSLKIDVLNNRLCSSLEILPADPLLFSLSHSGNRKELNSGNEFRYIEEILERGLEDGRKRFILYCASRYLVNVKGFSEEKAVEEIMRFVEKSELLPGFCGSGKIYKSWVRSVVKGVKEKKLKPYRLSKLKENHHELYEIVSQALGDYQ